MYYCNKCGFLGSAEHKKPGDKQVCGNCYTNMRPMKMDNIIWNNKTEEEKESIKEKLYQDAQLTGDFDINLHSKRERLNERAKGPLKCPICNGENIHSGQKGYSFWTGFLGSGKVIITCLNCGHKWEPGKNN
jgi:DNA-directed RNA polymerase subunit M/transcription elongation factor TFIIS